MTLFPEIRKRLEAIGPWGMDIDSRATPKGRWHKIKMPPGKRGLSADVEADIAMLLHAPFDIKKLLRALDMAVGALEEIGMGTAAADGREHCLAVRARQALDEIREKK
jgi:hypothetical protein